MTTWDAEERIALVALLRARPEGLSWPQITALVTEVGSAKQLWEQYYPAGLFTLPAKADEVSATLASARHDIEEWESDDFEFLTFKDTRYPPQLRDVHQVPPVLFTRGELMMEDRGISVVGSRAASGRGIDFARAVSTAFTERGISVLSGLAQGIDTAAHEAALEAGGRTVAVVGTGIRKVYPAENRDLQARIVKSNGLVISQFWPDSPPSKQTFPMRNATMSAYGLATIVVEASEHSGTRIQARVAVAHGRPVILTDLVLSTTKWAQSLLGKPGVFHARTELDAIRFAEKAIESTDELSRLRDLITR